MRTLRYLGIVHATGITGEKADKVLDIIKSMPDVLGVQEQRYLISLGISIKIWKTWERDELLDYLWRLGRDEYIKKKISAINDETLRIKTMKELIKQTRKNPKLIHSIESDVAESLLDFFLKTGKCCIDKNGNKCYCKMSINEYTIEAKYINNEEYFVITKIQ